MNIIGSIENSSLKGGIRVGELTFIENLCHVTDAEFNTFLLICLGVGLLVGLVLTLLNKRKAGKAAGSKGFALGCFAPLIAAFVFAAYLGVLLDPPDCGVTPDIVFFPLYAFIIVAFVSVMTYWLRHILEKDK